LDLARPESLLLNAIIDYAIYMLDVDGYVTSWNAGAAQFKGYTRDEILGKHFSIFYTDEDRAAGLPERALQQASTEGRVEMDGWRVRKDGTRFWANVVVDSIKDPEGKLIGFAKVTRDLTERMAAETTLRKSEEQFRRLVQGVTDYAIYMLDPGGLVSSWNAGAARIKGYASDEIIGQHFSRFYTEVDRAAGVPQEALATAERVGRYEKEALRVRKDGTPFWAHVVIDAIHDDDGRLLGFAKITRDITERKKAQEALDATKTALFQSQKMEAVGQLTGGVAHDFNNLLTVIVGGLDLLAQRLREPADQRLLTNMHRAAQRGQDLTRQLLAFARRQPLKPELKRTNALVRGFLPVLERVCPEGVALTCDLRPGLPPVLIDGPQLEVALLNLVVNARDAMPSGGSIMIATRLREVTAPESAQIGVQPGTYVSVMVKDSGMGMSPDVRERAIEPFFTTKEVGKGTGLGLSQVFGFAAQSGGALQIESELGLGTQIRILLPTASGDDKDGEGEHSDDVSPVPAGSGTVLIVEDEEAVREVAIQLFETLGYEVMAVTNGAEAIQVLSEQSFDVLFSDVVMPKGPNGVEVAKQAKLLRPDIKILLASGFPMGALKDRGLTDDYAFVSKPYRWSELVERLRFLKPGE
jgi:PAS domain S-box-containing protein